MFVSLATRPEATIDIGSVMLDGHEYSLANVRQAMETLSQKEYLNGVPLAPWRFPKDTRMFSDILEAQRKERERNFFWHIESCGWEIIGFYPSVSDFRDPDKTVDGRVMDLALGFAVWGVPVTIFLRGKNRPTLFETQKGPAYHLTIRGDYEVYAERMIALYNNQGIAKDPWESRCGYGLSGPGWQIVCRTEQTGYCAHSHELQTEEDLDEAKKFGQFLQEKLHEFDWRKLILKKERPVAV